MDSFRSAGPGLGRLARRTGLAGVVVAALALGVLAGPVAAATPLVDQSAVAPGQSAFGVSHRHVCGAVPKGYFRCHSDVVTDSKGKPLASSTPTGGYFPADLQSAYGITGQASSGGSGQTIAIVDAYDHPNAEADLGVYRSQFGLPACTTANGCFRKVNQDGGTSSYPATNAGWAQEISLDLDMASAICPNCHILLVEADSSLDSDLDAAVDRAAAMGATQISNSYGGPEYSGETTEESHFNHPGSAITASSGDSGYGVEYPAASRYVTAVGGTSLTRNSSVARGWSETAWSGAGSGCSSEISKPSWQTDSGCSNRTVADVSADADPNTGVAVYDSLAYKGASGWLIFGGTSVAAPIVAGFDALLGSAAATLGYPYSHTSSYNDVTSGSNGQCQGSYLCTAKPGYDGPTGLGTPKGGDSGPPPAAPGATTNAATNVVDTGATLNGSVNPNGQSTTYRFDYGTSTSYGSTTANTSAGSASSATAVSANISSLTPNTTYHFRVEATNATGTTFGADKSFRTPGPPSVAYSPVTNVTATGATLNGSVNPDGHQTTYHFEYGTDSTYGTSIPVPDGSVGSGTSAQSVSANLGGLTSGTTYHYRLVATGDGTQVAGGDQTFTTSIASSSSGSGGTTGGGTTTGTTTTSGGTTTTSSPLPDLVAPVISNLRLSRSVFRAARYGPSIATVGVGTRVRFLLSEDARVTFRLQRARPGRKVNGRCVRPTSRNRTRPRCTRWVRLRGYVRRSAHAGSNRFRFRGRWRRHRLRAGHYRLLLTPVDAAGNRGRQRRVRFRIVP